MSLLYQVFLWLIVLLGSGLSVWIIFIYWEPVGSTAAVSVGGQTAATDSGESWRNLLLMKTGATAFLAFLFVVVDQLLPGRLPPVLTQVAWTLMLALFAAEMVALGTSLFGASRHECGSI